MYLEHDGRTLSFNYFPKQGPCFVMMHGLGGDRTFFSYIERELSKTCSVLNIDLPGHGKSHGIPEDSTIERFAKEVGWICESLDIKQMILLGHSVGGPIALELSTFYPDLVLGIICLESPLLSSKEILDYLHLRLEQFESPHFLDYAKQAVKDSSHRIDAEKVFDSVAQYVWTSLIKSIIDWNATRAETCIKACRVPLLSILAGAKPFADELRIQSLCQGSFFHGRVVGSTHYLTIDVPEQILPMIHRFLEVTHIL